MEDLILTLLNLQNIGNKTIEYILRTNKNIKNDEKEILHLLREVKLKGKIKRIYTLDDIKIAIDKTYKIKESCIKQNIKIVSILESRYPEKLRYINDRPTLLFYKGNYNAMTNNKSIAIVGSRKASIKGLKSSYNMAYLLGKDGYSIISGLAKGCDEQAHKGCLDAFGSTVAVLPCPLDNIYPKSNVKLANDIVDNKGCLVSEYPLGSNIHKSNFIRRNRLQSGLSNALIVCETNENSGTNHTVNFCISQNRILSCINIKRNVEIINNKNCIVINDECDVNKLKEKIENGNKNYIDNCEQLIFNL